MTKRMRLNGEYLSRILSRFLLLKFAYRSGKPEIDTRSRMSLDSGDWSWQERERQRERSSSSGLTKGTTPRPTQQHVLSSMRISDHRVSSLTADIIRYNKHMHLIFFSTQQPKNEEGPHFKIR